jgi:ligand-binding sensor domain-containing protein
MPAYAVRDWHLQDGLPSEQVTAVTQDLRGYLWVLAGETAMRFDGTNFLSVASVESADAGATATRIIPGGGRDGAVLVITANGIVAFDPAAQRGTLVLPSEQGVQFTAAHAASDGTLWAAGSDGALIRQQNGVVEVLRPFGKLGATRPAAFVTSGDGELWVMIGRALGRLVQGQWQSVPLESPGDEIRIAFSRTDGPCPAAGLTRRLEDLIEPRIGGAKRGLPEVRGGQTGRARNLLPHLVRTSGWAQRSASESPRPGQSSRAAASD